MLNKRRGFIFRGSWFGESLHVWVVVRCLRRMDAFRAGDLDSLSAFSALLAVHAHTFASGYAQTAGHCCTH